MIGKWVSVEGNASEVYDGRLKGPLVNSLKYWECGGWPNLIQGVLHRDLDKVHISLEDGFFEAYKPFGRACRVVFEKGLDSNTRRKANTEFLERIYVLTGEKGSHAQLRANRFTEDGIEFDEIIKWNRGDYCQPSGYQVCVQLPDDLVAGREKSGEYEYIVGKDKSRMDKLNSICEIAEKEGFNVERKNYDCFEGACICPKKFRKSEIEGAVSHLMLSPKVRFMAESGRLGIKHNLVAVVDSGDDRGFGQNLKLEAVADLYKPLQGENLLGDPLLEIVGSSGANVSSDSLVSLKRYEKSHLLELAGGYATAGLGALSAPIFLGADYASGKWGDFRVWLDESKTNLDRRLHPKQYLITDTLQEGKARGGDDCSCVYWVDPVCMTNRSEKKSAEKSQE